MSENCLKLKDNEYLCTQNFKPKEEGRYIPILTAETLEDLINYALTYRNINKSKTNFYQVFKFDYTEEIFTNKNFLEEFSNIIKIESKN